MDDISDGWIIRDIRELLFRDHLDSYGRWLMAFTSMLNNKLATQISLKLATDKDPSDIIQTGDWHVYCLKDIQLIDIELAYVAGLKIMIDHMLKYAHKSHWDDRVGTCLTNYYVRRCINTASVNTEMLPIYVATYAIRGMFRNGIIIQQAIFDKQSIFDIISTMLHPIFSTYWSNIEQHLIDMAFEGACAGGHLDLVDVIVKDDIFKLDHPINLFEGIFWLGVHGNYQKIKKMMTDYYGLLATHQDCINHALLGACSGGHLACVKDLIADGATNFHHAAWNACLFKHQPTVFSIITSLEDASHTSQIALGPSSPQNTLISINKWNTVLFYSIDLAHTDIMQYAIINGANISPYHILDRVIYNIRCDNKLMTPMVLKNIISLDLQQVCDRIESGIEEAIDVNAKHRLRVFQEAYIAMFS